MNEKLKEALENTCEDLGLSFYYSATDASHECVEIEGQSPAGEDLIVSLVDDELNDGGSIVKALYNNWDWFDADEHAAEWYGANRGEPKSLRVLLDDADAIKEMYSDLCVKVKAGLIKAGFYC